MTRDIAHKPNIGR